MNDETNRQYDPQFDQTQGRDTTDQSDRQDLGERGAADNARGNLNQAGGKIQEGLGKLTGNDDLENEGKMRQVKGNLQDTAGNAERKADDLLDH